MQLIDDGNNLQSRTWAPYLCSKWDTSSLTYFSPPVPSEVRSPSNVEVRLIEPLFQQQPLPKCLIVQQSNAKNYIRKRSIDSCRMVYARQLQNQNTHGIIRRFVNPPNPSIHPSKLQIKVYNAKLSIPKKFTEKLSAHNSQLPIKPSSKLIIRHNPWASNSPFPTSTYIVSTLIIELHLHLRSQRLLPLSKIVLVMSCGLKE